MYLSVKEVKPLPGYRLKLTFENSAVRVFDMGPYLDTGVFRGLRDESLFKRVRVSFDTVEWPNGADIDPEILYEKGEGRKKTEM
ncbi:MAG: DUF2442 domain-containing protein [Treponematales bacterium]